MTKKESQVLHWIQSFQQEFGGYPTYREIQDAFSWKSINSSSQFLKQLARKGCIELLKNRGYRLPRGKRVDFVSVPWLGTVQAGSPNSTQEKSEPMTLPQHMLSAAKQAFVLVVRGSSMETAGILEGDIVVVDSEKRPKVGDIVVALVEEESTLKRLVEKNGKKYLKAESTVHPDIHPSTGWNIQGVVKGLWRKY